MRNTTPRTKMLTLIAILGLGMIFSPTQGNAIQSLEQEVRHQLVMQPFYGIFDNLEFAVDGGHVTLVGQVVLPVLKTSVEKAVRGIPGVTNVTNQIEVLPVSPNDDRIRHGVWRSIYSEESLMKYGTQAVPPIHIIVKNGHVTLIGVVNDQADSTMADMAAKRVPGIFSVTNQLRTEHA